MTVKTFGKRITALLLSFAIMVSTMAGLSLSDLMSVSAASESLDVRNDKHVIINEWHTTDEKGEYQEEKLDIVIDAYIHENTADDYYSLFYRSYVKTEDTTDYSYIDYTYIEYSSSDKPTDLELTHDVYATFDTKTGDLIIYSNEFTEEDSSKAYEAFAGFSVSAGHTAVDIQDTDGSSHGEKKLIIHGEKGGIHLVKSHVFYTNKSLYVAGINKDNDLVSGSGETDLFDDPQKDTFYAYIDDDGNLNPVDDNSEIEDGKYEGKELTKYYNTEEGLHTDKTAMEAFMGEVNDGRTFDLSLEAWFVGTTSANVGLIPRR